jgi:hypothetical protein
MAPMAEPLDLDTMLYLPGFSPEAERESLGGRGWGPADWVSGEAPVVQNGASRLETILPGEPLYAEIALEPLLGSGCSIVAADLSAEGVDAGEAEAELDDQTQVEAAPDSAHDLPAFVAESNDLDEFALESEIEVGAAVGERANAAETPASIDWEERGMSEAVQSRTDQGSLAGLQALGERIANPFLHEPQPRPGSGTPRWTPATAALGTGAPLATEDWDIL